MKGNRNLKDNDLVNARMEKIDRDRGTYIASLFKIAVPDGWKLILDKATELIEKEHDVIVRQINIEEI